MQEINRQEIIRQLRNAFGFRGSTAFELSESVIPVANIADVDYPPFHIKVGGAASVTRAAGGAGTFATTVLGMKAGAPQNTCLVVRKLIVATPGVAVPNAVVIGIINQAGLAGVAFTDVVNVGTWDSVKDDTLGVVRTVGQLRHATPAAAFMTELNGLVVDAPGITAEHTPLVLEMDWCITPGNHLVVMSLAANIGVRSSFYWDEYYLA